MKGSLQTHSSDTKKSKSGVNLAFVYGSLKRGFPNHRVMGDANLEGGAFLFGNYGLMDLGAFPGAIKTRGPEQAIQGELYRLNEGDLGRLDRLESNGSFYQREEKDVVMGNGAVRRAIVYFLMDGSRYGKERPADYLNDAGVPVQEWGYGNTGRSEFE